MDNLLALSHADAPAAITARFIDETSHEQFMGFEQVFGGCGLECIQCFVSDEGIANFLNLFRMTEDSFAIEHRSDLLEAECILLDLKRGLNRAYPIGAAKLWGERLF